MESNDITFDELDKKLLKELPLLIDVISSTFNKISIVLDDLFLDLQDHIKKELQGKKWRIDSAYKPKQIFYPFISSEYTNKTKITKLENWFSLEGNILLSVKNNKRWLNYLWIYLGYYYSTEFESNEFSFGIERWGDLQKYGGELFNKSFYKKMDENLKKYPKIELHSEHPSEGENSEIYGIYFNKLDTIIIHQNYEIFRKEIVDRVLAKLW